MKAEGRHPRPLKGLEAGSIKQRGVVLEIQHALTRGSGWTCETH